MSIKIDVERFVEDSLYSAPGQNLFTESLNGAANCQVG